MPNSSEPDPDADGPDTEQPPATEPTNEPTTEPATEKIDTGDATEVFATEAFTTEAFTSGEDDDAADAPERRFTAPGFEAGATEVIHTAPDPATEAIPPQSAPPPAPAPPPPQKATPQLVPPRLSTKLPAPVTRTWGWVLALILIILALAAIAILGTVWLTRDRAPKVSQEDQVRSTIGDFDAAVQTGDLTALRTITCGNFRDRYVKYNDQAWSDTHQRIADAKQYPVVASIDQVVVNGDHAEANVTAFMAYAPQMRSTRSFDLQFRDDQWKICQSPTG